MARIHRTRALGLSIAVMLLGMAAGCLTLTTTQSGEGGSGGSSMSTSSGGGSTATECTSVQDCPSITWCKTMACTEGHCVSGFTPAGSDCNDNRVCDGAGSCVRCLVDNDCSGDNATCENNDCISCSDGEKNGDETGVDCGGSKCAPCPTTCTSNNECASNNCVDGFCCDTTCTATCKACNIAGKEGKCSSLPFGTEDPGLCDTTQACNGGFTAKCLLKNGQSCADDAQCLSDKCNTIMSVCEP